MRYISNLLIGIVFVALMHMSLACAREGAVALGGISGGSTKIEIFDVGNGVNLQIKINGENFQYRTDDLQNWKTATDEHMDSGGGKPFILMDVNKDGIKDIFVKIMDGNSDSCYNLTIVEEQRYPATEVPEIFCNPYMDASTGDLISISHYGPFVGTEVFSWARGEITRISKSYPVDYDLEEVTYYSSGESMISKAIKVRGTDADAYACVIRARSMIYRMPASEEKTRMYLVSGDFVRISDYYKGEKDRVKIEFLGKSSATGWMDRNDLSVTEEASCPPNGTN